MTVIDTFTVTVKVERDVEISRGEISRALADGIDDVGTLIGRWHDRGAGDTHRGKLVLAVIDEVIVDPADPVGS